MKAVVLAYHDIGCAGIAALLRHEVEIAAVFTHRDDPGENIWFESVAECAAGRGIPVFAPEDVNHPLWVAKIRQMAPDILFSFYYRKMVKQSILDIPRRGCLNLHGSLLPRYRGRSPINWVLVNGEKETGVTLHHMTMSPDAGDIVAQRRIPISDDDTAKTLMAKATEAAIKLLDESLPLIKEGTAPRTRQDESKASYVGGRKPADGEIDWSGSATEIRNLVRAVTRPYPGAFSHSGMRKVLLWSVAVLPDAELAAPRGAIAAPRKGAGDPTSGGASSNSAPPAAYRHAADANERRPGAILSVDPLVIACGQGRVQVQSGQAEDGVVMSGPQLARELGLAAEMVLDKKASVRVELDRPRHVLILGVNGFIGSALSERLLAADGVPRSSSSPYIVHGMDLWSNNIRHLLRRPGFEFDEGDISIHREWLEYHVRKCDVVLPLVAIATPIEYTRNPLRVFELDFEENLRVVRYCAKYRKRIVFPSTSEVYGMCDEPEFDEDRSKLVLGPINKQRWIYSCSKQLLDRVIWAYGAQENLKFTLFRPFNWIGPRLDSLDAARIGSSRAITQLILNLVEGTPIQLIDGGEQKRCFTDVADGVECLFRIIENKNSVCDRKIINIGNPTGELSIRELAKMLVAKFERHPLREKFPPFAGFRELESQSYYGEGYEDVQHRRPSIRNARKLVGWSPTTDLEKSVERTLDYFLHEYVDKLEGRDESFVDAIPF